ncbi:MAG: D-glycero-beta-D-manno-heptose 1,7-bisphosphate 7-phosphatase [Glaciimonas sp.]|nr:D-glycero-beta-D-manno-heptose 1,7-bisphosphate 7-phosphatase [Glaciimonas sp.]
MKLIILDRDGVINFDSASFIKTADEWQPIPGSLEAIARLNQAGYQVVICTNQSGIARGLLNMNALNAIHQKMHMAAQEVGAEIDAIFFCPHAASDNCDCRKPKSGMFLEIAKRYEISLKGIPNIGDSLRDLQAGFNSGCISYLVLTGKGTKTQTEDGLPPDTLIYPDLAAAVDGLLDATETTDEVTAAILPSA